MKSVVFIDGDHLYYALKAVEEKIDYRKLLTWLEQREGTLYNAFYYSTAIESKEHHASLSLLARAGWTVVVTPEENYDIKMAVDMLAHGERCDKLILFSGDADFGPVLQLLQERGTYTEVIGFRAFISDALMSTANRFVEISELALAPELSDSFWVIAHLALEREEKDVVATLVGVRLESALKKLADRHGLEVSDKKGLDSLNNRLASAGVYTSLTKRRITVWAEIRNNVVHGRFDQYTISDVKEMFNWVSSFCEEHGV